MFQKLKDALTHKSLSMDNNNFTSFSIDFYEWSKKINTTRYLIRISFQPFYSVRKIRKRFTYKLVFKILAKNVVRAIWLANGKIVSDVRLNAMLLDVWEAKANQDIHILIRLVVLQMMAQIYMIVMSMYFKNTSIIPVLFYFKSIHLS